MILDKRDSIFSAEYSLSAIPSLALEPRFMFDAAGAAMGAEVAQDAAAQAEAEQASFIGRESGSETAKENPAQKTTDIVVVDTSVEGYQDLLVDLAPGTEVILIDGEREGILALARALKGRSGIDSLNILSHGDTGLLSFGKDTLTSDTIEDFAGELATIGSALSEDADILLYGCQVGDEGEGQAFIGAMALATGADIAASDDLTGASGLGGDWDLEVMTGNIEAVRPFSEQALADFSGVLFSGTINFSTVTTAGSLGGANTVDAQFGGAGGYTLVLDGASASTYGGFGRGYTSGGETQLTIEFNGGETFDPTSIYVYNISGASDTLIATSDVGGSVSSGALADATGTTLNISSFGTGVSKIYISAQDGSGYFSVDNLVLANVGPANAAPTISVDNSTLAYTENGSATQIDGAATVSDADGDADWDGGTLTAQITANAEAGDQISIVDSDGDGTAITISGTNILANGTDIGDLSVSGGTVTNNTVLTITFDSDATNANVQEVLQSLRYSNTSEDPGTPNRTVTLTATDTNSGTNNDTRTISVAAINDEPTFTATGSNPTFTEGGAAASLFTGSSVSTVEAGQTVAGFTLTVTNLADGSNEILNADGTAIVLTNGTAGTTATNSLSYSVSVTGSTATVTFSGGTVSSAAMQTLVNALSYQNNSQDPDTSNRVVTLTSITDSGSNTGANDNVAALAIASTVTVTELNDEPTLTAAGSNPTFTEGGAAASLFSGSSVSTVESGQTLTGFTLTVTNLTDGSNEILNADGTAITLTNATAGTTATNSLSYSVSVTGSTATVTFSGGTVSTAAMQTLVNGMSFQNNSQDPGTANRVVALTSLTDSGSNVGANDNVAALAVASTVTVTAVNDEPTLNATGSNPTFTEGGAAASLFSSTSVSTVESGQTVAGFTLTVTNLADGSNEILNADGTAITLTHGTAGTTATNSLSYSVSVSGSTATVTFSGGTVSTAAMQTLVNALSYQNNSQDPDTSNRVVTLTSITDSGSNAGANDNVAALAIASTVTVTELNDKPTLSATGSNPTFTEGGSAASLFSGSSVSTVESGQTLTGFTLTVTNLADGGNEILNADGTAITLTNATAGTTATNSLSYSVSVSGSTATVTFSGGTVSTAAMQTLVNALSYQNNSQDLGTANRVVTLTSLTDSGSNVGANDNVAALAVASTVTITALNDEPTLTATGTDPNFTAGGPDVSLFNSATVATIESGQTLTGLTLTVTNLADGSDEILIADGTAITLTHGTAGTTATNSLSYSVSVTGSTATVTFSGGTVSTAAMQTLVEALSYQNNNGASSTNNRVVTLTSLTDSGSNAGANDNVAALAIASTVSVTSINTEPTLTAVSFNPTFTEGGAAAGLYSGSAVSTVEGGQTLTDFEITVTNLADGSNEILNADGSAITLTHGTAGTTATNSLSYSVSVTGTTATVTFSGGTVSSAAMQTLVDALSYQNNSNDPDTNNRVVTLTSLTDSGSNVSPSDNVAALAVASTVTLVGLNDEPTLTATGSNPNFTEGGSAVGLFSGTTVSTVEGGQTIVGFTLTVTNLSNGSNELLNADGSAITLTHGTAGTTATNGLTYGVSVSGSTATVTFSAGTLSPSAMQTLVNGMSYQNSSQDPGTGNRVVTLTSFTDSGSNTGANDNLGALAVASTVTVTAINDQPTLTVTGTNPTFTEGESAASLFSGSVVSTVEAGQSIAGFTLTVTNLADGSDEILVADGRSIALTSGTAGTTASNGLSYSVSVSGSTATVTFSSGSLSTAAMATLINGLAYQNDHDITDNSTRVVTLTSITDSGSNAGANDNQTSLSIASTVSVAALNTEPTLTATPANPTFTEGGSAAGLFSASAVSTVEGGQTITAFSLTVANLADGSDEILNADGTAIGLIDGASGTTVTNGFHYVISVTGSTATVTFSGGAAASSAMQTLINGLSYQNHSQDPDTGNRVITLTSLTDSGSNVAPHDNQATLALASTVSVIAINDEPTLTASPANPVFTEGDGVAGLFSDSVISTVEADQTIVGFTLTVANLVDGADEVLNADGTEISLTHGVGGNTATTGFTYSVSVTGSTATVTFSSGSVTSSAMQTLVNELSYQNNSNDPDTSTRTVTLTSLTDSGLNTGDNDNQGSLAQASSVTVKSLNDEPTLTATGSDPAFTEGDMAVGLFSDAVVSTIENGQTLSGFTLTVSNLADGSNEILSADGSAITLTHGGSGNTAINAFGYNVSVAGNTATVTFSGGTATPEAMQTLVEGLGYQNTSDDQTADTRVITLTRLTDSGANTGGSDNVAELAVASTVTVTAINDEPTLTTTGSDPTFTEGGAAAGLFSGTAVSTVESEQTITGFALTVKNLADGSDEILNADGTAIALINGAVGNTMSNDFSYSVSVTGNTATVTFSGGTLATSAMQTLIDALSYQNNSDDPNTGNRVVTLMSLTDSGTNIDDNDNLAELAVASTVTVSAVNDEPTLTTTGSNPTFIEGGAAAGLFSSTAVSTVESGQTITGFAITISHLADGSDEILNADGTAIALINGAVGNTMINGFSYSISVTGNTATVSFSGGTVATSDMQTLVDALSYQNNSEDPNTGTRVVTLTTLTDSGSNFNGNDNTAALAVSSSVSLTAVNDEPSLTATAVNPIFTENGDAASLFSDTAVSTVEAGQNITGFALTVSNLVDGSDEIITADGTEIALTPGTQGATTTHGMNYSVSVTRNTATVNFSGEGLSAETMQTLVDTLSYRNNSDDPEISDRVVTLTSVKDSGSNDGNNVAETTLALASTVTLTAINDAPTLTTTATNPTFTEGESAVSVFSNTLVSTVESGQTLSGFTLTVANLADGEHELLQADGTAIALTDGTTGTTDINSLSYDVTVSDAIGTLVFSGGDLSSDALQTLLDALIYQNSSDDPDTNDRVVTLTSLTDSGSTEGANHNTAELSLDSSVSLIAVNDDPTVSGVSASLTVVEDVASPLDLSSIEFEDLDQSESVTVTLTVVNGVLTIGESGNDDVSVSGAGSASLTLTGTVTAINAYLKDTEQIQYTGAPDDEGSDTLALVINDEQGSGNLALGSIAIDISPVQDDPVVSGTFTGVLSEGDPGDSSSASGTIDISDVDVDDNPSFQDVAATRGDNGYGSFVLKDGIWTYTLDQESVQRLGIGESVIDSITYRATDGTDQSATVTINGSNDAPSAAAALPAATVNEDNPFNLPLPDGSFVDIDQSDSLTYRIAPAGESELPQWLSIDQTTGALSGIPVDIDNPEVIELDIIATDKSGEQASNTQTLTVYPARVIPPTPVDKGAPNDPPPPPNSGRLADSGTPVIDAVADLTDAGVKTAEVESPVSGKLGDTSAISRTDTPILTSVSRIQSSSGLDTYSGETSKERSGRTTDTKLPLYRTLFNFFQRGQSLFGDRDSDKENGEENGRSESDDQKQEQPSGEGEESASIAPGPMFSHARSNAGESFSQQLQQAAQQRQAKATLTAAPSQHCIENHQS